MSTRGRRSRRDYRGCRFSLSRRLWHSIPSELFRYWGLSVTGRVVRPPQASDGIADTILETEYRADYPTSRTAPVARDERLLGTSRSVGSNESNQIIPLSNPHTRTTGFDGTRMCVAEPPGTKSGSRLPLLYGEKNQTFRGLLQSFFAQELRPRRTATPGKTICTAPREVSL
jgi:hypothetical protein